MTGTMRSSAGLDQRRRRLLFRSWHRGMREVDLVLGGFADACIGDLTDAEIGQYEAVLDMADTALLPILLGQEPPPDGPDVEILRTIIAFRRSRQP